MAHKISKKPNLNRNSIPHQAQQEVGRLTAVEWNQVVNTLRIQANLNTEYLENLHRVLFSDWDANTEGFIDFPDEDIFGYILNIIEELKSVATVYVGPDTPDEYGNVVLWIDTSDEIYSIYIGIFGGVFTSEPADIISGGIFLSVVENILYGGNF
jgi:hypothetical protein